MIYKTNPNLYNGIFVVPSVFADKYLLLASPSMLKTAIFAMRHGDKRFDGEFIATGTGLSIEEANEALEFWCREGILARCDKPLPEVTAQEEPKKENSEPAENPAADVDIPTEKKPQVKKTGIRTGKIPYQQICARLNESEEVRLLFTLAQEKLGRTIGSNDQSVLLSLYDQFGLPIEVILTLCHYATVNGKGGNLNYIFAMGSDWSDREILTLEDADEELQRLEKIDSVWADFRKATGITAEYPTTPQKKYLSIWHNEWNFNNNMIVCAYEEMTRHTDKVSFPYMNSILGNWHSAGLKTPEEAQEYQKKHQQEKEQKALKKKTGAKPSSAYGVHTDTPQAPASYDLEKATELMNLTVPEYRKKEKR